jgi:hypothetical protein
MAHAVLGQWLEGIDMTKSKSSDDSGKITAELPAVTLEETPAVADALAEPGDNAVADVADEVEEVTDESRATRDLAPAFLEEFGETQESDENASADAGASLEAETGPSAEMSAPVAAVRADEANGADSPDAPPEPERPRHHTLASMTRARGGTNPQNAPLPPPPPPPPAPEPPAFADDEILDETEYGARDEEEWSIAEQPTVALAPGTVLSARPRFLDTDERAVWPPLPASEASIPGTLPEAAASLHRRAIPRPDRTGLSRFASPNGRPMPGESPTGFPRTAFPDPRMQRLQELHRRRDAKEHGEEDPATEKQVTERVRQWWSDLRPGLRDALEYQHEARASGVHPIPAYEAAPSSRLGDVFGRLTASARGLTERARPAFERLHNQAEHAAQAIVGRFEPDAARQQAPFLGPGRVAVFFRSGVSVGQAQRLLSSNEARPLRIIPRKHGFLAYVLPGTEEMVSNRLRIHPYVRDVIFMSINEYGDPDEQDRDDDE